MWSSNDIHHSIEAVRHNMRNFAKNHHFHLDRSLAPCANYEARSLCRIEAETSGSQAGTMQAEAAPHKIWRRRGLMDQLKTDFQIEIVELISKGHVAATFVTYRA